MNDWKTKDAVAFILNKMGYKLLTQDALEGNNIDTLIKFIKHKYVGNQDVQEFITYFL